MSANITTSVNETVDFEVIFRKALIESLHITEIILWIFISIATASLNMIAMVTLQRTSRLGYDHTTLLGSVLFADFLMGIITMPGMIAVLLAPFHSTLKVIIGFFGRFLILAGMNTIGVIVYKRFMTVRSATAIQLSLKKYRVWFWLVGAWGVSFIATICQTLRFIANLYTALFVLNMVVICLLSFLTIRKLNNESTPENSNALWQQRHRLKRSVKIVRTMLLLTVGFWTFGVFRVLPIAALNNNVFGIMFTSFLSRVTTTSCLLDPVVFFYYNKEARQQLFRPWRYTTEGSVFTN